MKEIIIDNQYKYVFNREKAKWDLYFNNEIHPLEPENIFKYFACNIENISALYEGYFWLANPMTFNDPFDCNLNIINFKNPKNQKSDSIKIKNNLANIGISCFSKEIKDQLMWAHYTNNYNGFAIKFKKLKIKTIPGSKDLMDFQPVIYTDAIGSIKDTDPIAQSFLFSAKDPRWSYEKEWRIIKLLTDNDRQLFFSKSSVESIYIGHKIPDYNHAAYGLITQIIEEKYPNAKMYVVYPHPHKLELNFEQIYPLN